MDFKPQDFVHYLLAAAGAFPLDKPGVFLISEEDGDLIEKLWTGTEIADQVLVATDVRENTPALYLLGDDERSLFFVNKENVLQRCRYDPDEEVWDEVSLDDNFTVHLSGQLSGCLSPWGGIVILEGPEKSLRAYRTTGEEKLESLPPIPAGLEPGTPHQAVLSGDNAVNLLYVHCDGYIYHLVAEGPEFGEWKDKGIRFPYPSDNRSGKIVNFIVTPQEDGTLEPFVLMSGGMLAQIKSNGLITELGTVTQGQFTAHVSEECGIELARCIKKGIKAVGGRRE
ncbi:hypothetical protein FQN49_000252 [Arthroderma sp. PD_2]|nr:hypothetical protein FQN49_000252 [Arthroderma sp. PD_2]